MKHSPLQSAILAAIFALLAAGIYLSREMGGGDFFMPHSHCYLFNQQLMTLHGGADLLIGLAYVAISTTLVWLVYRARRELPFHWIMIAFAIFIVACGATHFMEVWTLTAEHPRYWLSGWVKLVTAIASVTTAVVLPPLIPHILRLMQTARLSAERGVKLERAYSELNELYTKVTQLDQLKTNFFANVSHELRTPLALIFAPVERLLQTTKDQAARHELTVVRRNALLLHKHVNDLLDVSKLEVGKLDLHYSRLDLAAMARAMANIFESVVSERGIRVELQVPGEVVAEVDGDKVQRVFMNLLSNAFKYAPNDSAVRLALTEDGDHLTLTVEDAGPGVPPDFRESIFERFQQGDRETQRRYGGTGLGLSIVKEFVEMHGGSITVGESATGGAQFQVRLPRRAPDGVEIHTSPWTGTDAVLQRLANAPATGRTENAQLPVQTVEADRPDVLVVEDNQDMRDFICRVLEPDAQTRTAENGRAALEAIHERVPDLILTDMMMPVMTGEELVAALRQDENLRDVPVILLTAKADDEMKLNLLIEGAQDYVLKPFSIDELRARVRNQLQTKLTRDMLRRALDTRSHDLAAMVRELAAAKTAAVAANAAKDDFLAVLSHELRTPLTPALAAASALMNEAADATEVRESLAIIRRNIELEARLVDDLLDVTRITQGKLRIHSTPADLHTILRDALAMVNPSLREKQITAVVDLAKDHLLIRGDAARLTQVFSNLLGNAAKFTPAGGQVTIRSTLTGEKISIEIEDTGIGIAPELLPQIFDPFRQGHVDTTRRFGGLGLGLSVAKGLVEAHRGTINVRSAGYKQGATFTVEFPALAAGSSTVNAPASASGGSAAPVRSLRVLLVEDHEDTRQILHRLMTRWGHTVTTASTVAQASRALASDTFDLLLSDIGLPDGSGLEVIAALRERSDIPAVAMSGYGMEADIARAHAAGFTEHIVKPVTADALRKMLTRFSAQPET
ncbi:ATP-binding protein [Prosthecobacter sp.]|uniref:ATP-binding protein n=1 Tax=Prosthecobacter sp. TaxID=1965333 RepID=UPI002AB8719B|nr:ATP-binding protein [Prosthecobacter sp.]MDZ4403976.1 ATP-binding protein [Prosthecobacter sp.]